MGDQLDTLTLGADPFGDAEADIQRFEEAAINLLERAGQPQVIVRLSGTAIRSDHLAAVIVLHKRVREREGWVRLAVDEAAVKDIIQKTRLDVVFDVFDTVEQAAAG